MGGTGDDGSLAVLTCSRPKKGLYAEASTGRGGSGAREEQPKMLRPRAAVRDKSGRVRVCASVRAAVGTDGAATSRAPCHCLLRAAGVMCLPLYGASASAWAPH